jgi:O-antigen/teichoic acid export membrane protein
MVRALLQLAQTMLLARLLAPADFGLMAVVASAFAVFSLFVDLGMSNALIHFQNPSRSARSTLYWLNIGSSSALMLVFAAIAWPFAYFYRQPEILPLMLAMSLAMPLSAAGQQFRVMAEKELRFSSVAAIDIVSSACGLVVALAAALFHGGAYSLVFAVLSAAATSSALSWLLLSRGIRPSFQFDFNEAKPYLRYGSYRLGDSLLNNVQSQADVLIGGAIVGPALMGPYSVPRDLSLRLANTLVNPVVTRVGLPVMAKIQNDKAALKMVYLQTIRMTSSINFPAYLFLAVWANDVVAVVLGEQWIRAGAYMRLFALWGLIRSTGNPVGSLLYATGHVRRAFLWNLVLFFTVPPLLWLGASTGGTLGLAATLIGVQVAFFLPAFGTLVRPACGASFQV